MIFGIGLAMFVLTSFLGISYSSVWIGRLGGTGILLMVVSVIAFLCSVLP